MQSITTLCRFQCSMAKVCAVPRSVLIFRFFLIFCFFSVELFVCYSDRTATSSEGFFLVFHNTDSSYTQLFNETSICRVSQKSKLIFSKYVNETEKIEGMWTNMNSYRENEALSGIFPRTILRHNCFMFKCSDWKQSMTLLLGRHELAYMTS